MNLFRSEEHIRHWSGFKPGTEAGILPLAGLVQVFAGPLFTRRLDPDYVSRISEYLAEFVGAVSGMGSFWEMGGS